MRELRKLLIKNQGKIQRDDNETLFKIAHDEYQLRVNLEARTYLMTFSENMSNVLLPLSNGFRFHHLGLYIGEYETEEEFREELSYFLELGKNEVIEDLEYGKSEIALDKYNTDGWWISFNWNEIRLELFSYKTGGCWGDYEVEEKVNRVSHVAYQIPSLELFQSLHEKAEAADGLEIIRSVECDELGHTYMHILDRDTGRVIEIIFDPNAVRSEVNQSKKEYVAVVGVGKMGNCVARSIPVSYQLLLYDLNLNKNMLNLVVNKDAQIIHSEKELRKADYIIICVPADECERFLKEKKDAIGKDTVIVCISTGIRKETVCELAGNNAIVFVKIIAEAGEIMKGNKPLLILQNVEDKNLQRDMCALLGNFGEVISDSALIYNEVNYISACKVIEAIFEVRDIFSESELPERVINKAITNVMAGTCSTYPWDENDVFINKVLDKLKNV